jgi:hypothetical protein
VYLNKQRLHAFLTSDLAGTLARLLRLDGDWISKILRRSTPFPVGTRLRVPWRIDTVNSPALIARAPAHPCASCCHVGVARACVQADAQGITAQPLDGTVCEIVKKPPKKARELMSDWR